MLLGLRPIASFIAALALCCLMAAGIACKPGSSDAVRPVAVGGVLDLGSWDPGRDGSVRLDGQWEFCRDRLMEPSDFAKGGNREGCGYIAVPGLWARQRLDGAALPGTGRATYRLTVLGGRDTKVKTMTIRRIYSQYRLWVNGVQVDTRGQWGRSSKIRDDYIYMYNGHRSSFTLKSGANEIVLQVENREYESGGIDWPIRLDAGSAVARSEFFGRTVDMIIVGLLLFAAVYNIIFYFFRKVDMTSLYIGFCSFLWAVNTYNIRYPVLSGALYYPANPFIVNYITAMLGTTFFFMIVRSTFPDDFEKKLVTLAQAVSAASVLLILFTGFDTAEKVFNGFFIFVLFNILYCIYVLVKVLMNRRENALLFSLGFIAMYVTGINTILFSLWIVDTGNAIQYGMVVFSFITTLIVSRRFARALGTVEKMSAELEAKNLSLEKSDRLKDQFLASTSHELRTPLHGMIGLSESMIEGAAGDLSPQVRENLSLIASSGHRLAGMVNDLLDMAKIQDEGLSLNLRPVDLRSLSDVIVKLSLALAAGKPLEIVNRIGPDVPRVRADEERIRRVLHNLVGNAIKFTNEGRVELSARVVGGKDGDGDGETGPMVEVRVSDTGIGVPEEYRETIFEAYRQADGSDTRSYPGTGLGLAISKRIVEQHGGAIYMAPGEGAGSVFSFTLPLWDGPPPDGVEDVIIESMLDVRPDGTTNPSMLPPGISGNAFDGNPVLLVVDDDPVNVRVVRNYFESKGCVVKTAADGIAALGIIDRDDSICLVLLDIMMPVMSGYDVCKRIRLKRPPEDLPVIMLTAKNMMADIDAAFEAGANDYIVKPFRISELLARVATMLALKNVRKSAAEGITIRDKNRAYPLKFGDIVYISSHSKNVVVHTAEGEIEFPVLLKDIIDRLPPDLFVRVHKSYVVNLRYVRSVSHVMSGRYRLRLRDDEDTALPVGPIFLESLRKKIQ